MLTLRFPWWWRLVCLLRVAGRFCLRLLLLLCLRDYRLWNRGLVTENLRLNGGRWSGWGLVTENLQPDWL